MANEINYIGDTGQSLTAQIYTRAGSAEGSVISLSEQNGIYSGDVPTLGAGSYLVLVMKGTETIASGELHWDGSNEIEPKSMAQLADVILSRDVSSVEDGLTEHTLAGIILASLESSRSSAGSEWTIRKTDGSTLVTKTLTFDNNANIVVGVS